MWPCPSRSRSFHGLTFVHFLYFFIIFIDIASSFEMLPYPCSVIRSQSINDFPTFYLFSFRFELSRRLRDLTALKTLLRNEMHETKIIQHIIKVNAMYYDGPNNVIQFHSSTITQFILQTNATRDM